MILNAMEKRLLFQVEGDCLAKVLNELHMVARYTKSPEQGDAAESLMAKLRPLTDAEGMDMVRDIQKNYRLPYPARTIGEKIAEARQQSGAEKLKGHDIMALERFDPEVKHMIVFACMRSITGSLRKDVYGSDKEYSFCFPPENPGSRNVAVFEAPIDALSHATLP